MTSLDGDTQVWARQVTRSRGKNTRQIPDAAHLEQAMGDMQFEESYEGAGTITMTVADPGWLLMDSGFFDADEDGKLDLIEVNYPEGSDDWWRLTQVGLSGSGGPRLELTFMARGACYAMSRKGPEQASRGEMTRAEFLASLFTGSRKGGTERGKKGIQAGGGLNFWSEELTKKQPIAAVQEDKKEKDRRQQKRGGIPLDDELKIAFFAGTPHVMTREEKLNAQEALDAATAISNDERALLALLCACIVEGPVFRNSRIVTDHDSVGILQARATHGSVEHRMVIANQVNVFMGDKGFTGRGGAPKLARENPSWSVGQIAQAIQGSAHPDRYDKCLDSAKKVLKAYGGAGSGGSADSYRTAYIFQIGDENDPNESYWDGAIRLAEEVNWRLFIAGKDVYFDSDMTLIRQKPVAVINRDDPAVVSWSGEWDVRNIATECELTLVCDPLEFRAGEVFKLNDFGPLSSASVAKRAGHWLIAQARRGRYDIATTFTLRQPEPPKPEPAPEMAQRGSSGEDAAAGEGVAGVYAMAERLDERAGTYSYGGGHGKAPKDIEVTDQLDCSSSTCKALSGGGMWPEDKVVAASGEIGSSWGEPGEGEAMTVWANAGHVFIEFKGRDRARLDTGGGPPSGPRLRASPRSTAGFTPRRWPGT